MIFVRSLIPVQFTLKHFVGGHCVSLRGMGVLEILSAAIETVCGLEVAWLHIMVDRLHVDHLLGV